MTELHREMEQVLATLSDCVKEMTCERLAKSDQIAGDFVLPPTRAEAAAREMLALYNAQFAKLSH